MRPVLLCLVLAACAKDKPKPAHVTGPHAAQAGAKKPHMRTEATALEDEEADEERERGKEKNPDSPYHAACLRFEGCKVQAYHDCLAELEEVGPKYLPDAADRACLASSSCESLKKSKPDCGKQAAKPAPQPQGGGGYQPQYPNGWFGGCWVDSSNVTHCHTPPPAGVF